MSQLRVSERCQCVAVRLLPRCAVPSAHAAARTHGRRGRAGGRGRPHHRPFRPAVKLKQVRYGVRATLNIHCVFYGTTATGKKCTVSRVRLVVTRRRSIGRPHRPVKFLPDFYPPDTRRQSRPTVHVNPHGTIKVVVAKVISVIFLSQSVRLDHDNPPILSGRGSNGPRVDAW